MQFDEAARQIATLGREFHKRGWALGTSGNFSIVISRKPLTLAITASGIDKGALGPEQVLELNGEGRIASQSLKPSSESVIHLAVARAAGAGSVLHTHSIWSTILSESFAKDRCLEIEGYEMLKGLAGVTTHLHKERLPIVENTQDWAAEAPQIEVLLSEQRQLHAFLIRGHGLYTWGSGVDDAKRHVEILEFLLEIKGRLYCAGSQ